MESHSLELHGLSALPIVMTRPDQDDPLSPSPPEDLVVDGLAFEAVLFRLVECKGDGRVDYLRDELSPRYFGPRR